MPKEAHPMEPRRVQMVLIVSLVGALWGVTAAQNDSSCTNVLISLSPCLDYVTGNVSVPSSACCSQLASVLSSQPQCLCEVVNGGAAASVGLNINQTQALTLPSSCRIQTPPLSICKASPPTSDSASVTTSFPSGNGYSTFSSAGGSGRSSSSHGNSIKQPSSLLGFIIFVTCLGFVLTWN